MDHLNHANVDLEMFQELTSTIASATPDQGMALASVDGWVTDKVNQAPAE